MTNADQFSQNLRSLRARLSSFANQLDRAAMPGSVEQEVLAQTRAVMDQLQATAEMIENRQREWTHSHAELIARFQAYRDILESAPCACIVTDLTGAVLDANNAAVRLLGYRDLAALRGKPLVVFIPLAERRDFRLRLVRADSSAEVVEWAGSILPRGRVPFSGWFTMTQVRDGHGDRRELCWTLGNRDDTAGSSCLGNEGESPVGDMHRQSPCDQIAQLRAQIRAFTDEQIAWQEATEGAVADDLYNRVGQDLAALLINHGRLAAPVAAGPGAQGDAADLARMIGAILVDLHDLATALHSLSLDRLGLVPALGMLAEAYGRSTGVQVDVEAVGLNGQRLSSNLEALVFRLVQEALAIMSAAEPTGLLSITLNWSEEWVRVMVETQAVTLRFEELDRRPGWLAVKSRVEMLGGAAGVESAPDGDTAIWAAIPAAETAARSTAIDST